MQSPSQVPPVPSLVFTSLSIPLRVSRLMRERNPEIVVTVFPPRPLFSRLISSRSPIPIPPLLSTGALFGAGDEDEEADSGKPSVTKESNGEEPKSSFGPSESFLSARRSLLLISRKSPFPVALPPARSRPLHSSCSRGSASAWDAGRAQLPEVSRPASPRAPLNSPGPASLGLVITLKQFSTSSISPHSFPIRLLAKPKASNEES